MFQALHKIEFLSLSLSSEALLTVGFVLTGAGLFAWLGGLRWHFVSAVLSGAFAGIVCSCFTDAQYQIQGFGIAAVITALLVGIFRKRSLVFVAAMVVVFSGLFISALPQLNTSSDWRMPTVPEMPEGMLKYPASDTFKILADDLFYFASMIGAHIKGLEAGAFAVLSIIGVCIIAVGIFFARLISAVGASMLGTFFVFSGMMALLLQKGSMPFSGIYSKPVFFQTLIICMVIFGSVCGFILCPTRRRRPDRENIQTEKKMNIFNILAEAESNGPGLTTAVENDVEWVPVDFIWNEINTLSWFHAVLAISFGIVYLLYGWRIFKALTVICFGLIGMFTGMHLGEGMGSQMWGGFIGLLVLAIVSVPLMKYCISLLGAAAGAILFGALWYACGLPQMYMFGFAIAGAIFGGMISFIVFKMSVMLFTSLGGSTIMMSGLLSLLHKYMYLELTPEAIEQGQQTMIQSLTFNTDWFLPVALLTPTFIGLILQNKFIRKSSEWEI